MGDDERQIVLLVVVAVVLLGVVFYVNVSSALDFLSEPISSDGLGNLCSSEADCLSFCSDNMGQCNSYCVSNPLNPLCGGKFG